MFLKGFLHKGYIMDECVSWHSTLPCSLKYREGDRGRGLHLNQIGYIAFVERNS
jgi:hypothetical protein